MGGRSADEHNTRASLPSVCRSEIRDLTLETADGPTPTALRRRPCGVAAREMPGDQLLEGGRVLSRVLRFW